MDVETTEALEDVQEEEFEEEPEELLRDQPYNAVQIIDGMVYFYNKYLIKTVQKHLEMSQNLSWIES